MCFFGKVLVVTKQGAIFLPWMFSQVDLVILNVQQRKWFAPTWIVKNIKIKFLMQEICIFYTHVLIIAFYWALTRSGRVLVQLEGVVTENRLCEKKIPLKIKSWSNLTITAWQGYKYSTFNKFKFWRLWPTNVNLSWKCGSVIHGNKSYNFSQNIHGEPS